MEKGLKGESQGQEGEGPRNATYGRRGTVWTLPILQAHPEGLFNLHEARHYRYLTRRFHRLLILQKGYVSRSTPRSANVLMHRIKNSDRI